MSTSLRRSVTAVLAGNGAYAASQLLMLMVLARVTDSAEVGRYALALAVTAPLFLLAGLKLRQVQVTDARGENTPGQFLALRTVTSLLALAASLAVAVAAALPVGVVAAVALNKVAEGRLDSVFGTLQRHEQMTAVARAQAARAVAGLAAFSAAVVPTRSAAAGALALAAVTLAVASGAAGVLRRQGRPVRAEYDAPRLWRLARLALPLGVSVALGSAVAFTPRYLLQHLEGSAAVGVFAALAYVTTMTGTVVQAVAESVSPRLANQFAAGDLATMRVMVGRLVLAGAGVGIVGVVACWLFARPALRLVFGPEYADAAGVLVVLMVAVTLEYAVLFVGTTIDAMRSFRLQAPLTALGLATALGTGWPLVERWGLLGAAWSAVATQVVLAVGHAALFAAALRPRLRRPAPRHLAVRGSR
ncbi:lipopolysaccharide biosynthesis protein [Nocardioides sp. R1-1]|uniref:lipopolysaccharide biosynthesis protein n=1 Tax=Nocardioides sp. R1-1 TaxID=3383502 RepID=UPI0038D15E7B